MALLKLPFRLGRPSNDTPVTTADAVDDETLQKTQAELNALFNQGKNAQGEQVGKTYSAGTGIEISQQDEISVSIPVSTDSQTGLMSAADHRRLNTHAFTVDFGANQDSVTVLHMDAACTLLRVATRNVASVTLSVVNGGTVTPALVSGAADISLALPADTGVVIDITRTSSGNAAVGVKYELS